MFLSVFHNASKKIQPCHFETIEPKLSCLKETIIKPHGSRWWFDNKFAFVIRHDNEVNRVITNQMLCMTPKTFQCESIESTTTRNCM
jgi:hypothetical protein